MPDPRRAVRKRWRAGSVRWIRWREERRLWWLEGRRLRWRQGRRRRLQAVSGATSAPPRVGVAVPAAGFGRRMGGVRKPWLELAGEPTLRHALRPFLADDRVVRVVI